MVMYKLEDIEKIINNLIITYIEKECSKMFKEVVPVRAKTYKDIKQGYKKVLEDTKDKERVEIYKKIYLDTLNYLFIDSVEDIAKVIIEKNKKQRNEELYVYEEVVEIEGEVF